MRLTLVKFYSEIFVHLAHAYIHVLSSGLDRELHLPRTLPRVDARGRRGTGGKITGENARTIKGPRRPRLGRASHHPLISCGNPGELYDADRRRLNRSRPFSGDRRPPFQPPPTCTYVPCYLSARYLKVSGSIRGVLGRATSGSSFRRELHSRREASPRTTLFRFISADPILH